MDDVTTEIIEEKSEEAIAESIAPESSESGETNYSADLSNSEKATVSSDRKSVKVGDRSLEIDPITRRTIAFDRAVIDEVSRTIEIPVSSESPVDRWWGTEVLSHRDSAVVLDRLNDAAPQLFNHDPHDYIGVVERAYLRDGRLYARMRFDRHEKANQIFNSVRDGILRNVSIGYTIDEIKEEKDRYVATRWTPLEVSIVTIPADNSVGIGRSLVGDAPPPAQLATPAKVEPEKVTTTEKHMETSIEEIRQQERDRIQGIEALCRMHKVGEDLAKKLIGEGASIDQARALVLERLHQQPPQPIAQPVNPLGLSEKEQREYSIRKAILAHITGDWSKAGFERECHKHIQGELDGRPANGFYVPIRDLKIPSSGQRATYAVGGATTGGNLVETVLDSANLIDYLRNRMMIMRMGARMLSGLVGNLDIPRQSGVASTYWVGEGGNVGQSESTFDLVQLRPKTIGVKSQLTRMMLLQSSIDIEAFIRQDLALGVALGIDLAALNGSGSSNQPRGVLNTSGIGSVALGTNGAAPTWSALVALETAIASANADLGSLGYLSNAKVRGALKTIIKNPSGTDSTFIWENGSDPLMGNVNGYNFGVSNQVPSNLTKGTGSNLSAIVFGNWSDLLIGEWGVFEIGVDNSILFDSGGVQIRALQTVDVAIRHPESFAAIKDAVAA